MNATGFCLALAPVEDGRPAPGLTPREAARAAALGPARRQAYLAVRRCLKRLARQLYSDLRTSGDAELETLAVDPRLPCLPAPAASLRLYCSAAHSSALAATAAAARPIGLDLEAGGDKAWRGRRVFLSPSELALVEASELGGEAAALRAWSCKEAAAKLCGLTLTRAWAEVEVRALGRRRSLAAVNGAVLVCRHGRRPVPLLTVIVAPEGWSRP